MSKSMAYDLSSKDYQLLVSLITALKNNGINVMEDTLEEFVKCYFAGKSKIILLDLILLINAKVIKNLSDLSLICQLLHCVMYKAKDECKVWLEGIKAKPQQERREDELSDSVFLNDKVQSEIAFDRNTPGWRLNLYPVYAVPYFQLYETIKKYYGYGNYHPENRMKIIAFIIKMISAFGTTPTMQKYVNVLFHHQEFWTDTESINEIDKSLSVLNEIETTRFSIFQSRDFRITEKKKKAMHQHIDSLVSTIADRYEKNERDVQLRSLLVKTKPTENPNH